MPRNSYIIPKCFTDSISQPIFTLTSRPPPLHHHGSDTSSSTFHQSSFVPALALAMANGAAIALLISALVLLALASEGEAQCMTVDTSSLRVCMSSIQHDRCEDECKKELQPYATQPTECICQLVDLALNLGKAMGVTRGKVNELIMNCGQAAPKCS